MENMIKLSERDLIKLALYAVVRDGKVNVSGLRHEVYRLMKLSKQDNDYLMNRGYDRKWKQIVRNLVSHRTLEKMGVATYDPKTGYYTATKLAGEISDVLLRAN